MEKKLYERPVLEMISFETKETLASDNENFGSFDKEWWSTDENGNIQP